MKVKILALGLMALLLWSSSPLAAAPSSGPRGVMEDSLNQIMGLLVDPASGDNGLWPDKRKEVVAIIDSHFDFEEMAKRCLARAWRKRSPEEKEHFVVIFKELLQNTYIDRLQTVSNEKISIEGVREKGKKAVVKTIVHHKRQDYSFIYKMISKNKQWYVYDVVIEGVSLVSNYRSQFSQVIGKDGYPALVARIEEKLEPGVAVKDYDN
ncbi:MAG: ABC transporter substrate-binding protein [Thermodesulfobacteriota bacterium]